MKQTLRIWLCGLAFIGSGWSMAQVSFAQDAVPDVTAVTNVVETNAVEQTTIDTMPSLESGETNSDSSSNGRRGLRREAVVAFGHDVELKAGERAEAVVVIGGSAKVYGDVDGAVVGIGGNVETHGNVREAAVAIGGNVTAGGKVRDAVVAVLGNVTLEPGAEIGGDVVAVGGKVAVGEGATVRGHVQEVDVALPGLGMFKSLGPWMKECVFKLRPLAPSVGWVWVVAGIAFVFYLLVAAALPKPVRSCVSELNNRPATTFLIGLLVKLMVPVIMLILAMTGIGVLVIPLLLAVLIFMAIIGKVALLEYLGNVIARLFGQDLASKPLIGFLIGTLVITALYLVPFLGFVVFSVVSIWGLGVATVSAFAGARSEKPPRVSPPEGGITIPTSVAPVSQSTAFAAEVATEERAQQVAIDPAVSAPPVQPPLPAGLEYPRAGFWERIGAAFLDMALLSFASTLVGPLIPFVALAYFAGMWAWKGTSIGGIVLKLQVVRQDGGPMTFQVALVRSLAAAFSAAVLFLGFFWIGWDPDKQGWHDKIAGTVVVRLPRSMPLVCL